jgi:hexosaminidase
MKNQYFLFFFFTFSFSLLMHCNSDNSEPHLISDYQIIPLPNNIAPGIGYFTLSENCQIEVNTDDKALQLSAEYLSDWLDQQLLSLQEAASGQKISLNLRENLAPEAYLLTITQKGVLIQGGSPQGVFYGVQSLLQLIQQQSTGALPVEIPCVHIEDKPAFAYRGLLLDVGRHLFPVEFIKKYIDILAQYKMNRFHWHLTEDQGWRIEIKQYPKLQEIAAYRDQTLVGHLRESPRVYDGKRYGGYYTQEEVKEIVQYAQDRFITIIPEIEMPGHAQAALAAYPELSCTGEDIKVKTEWGVSEEVYCPTEETFTFLENVLSEVMELFPSKYIHIGGDECPKTRWKESAFCQDLIQREDLEDEEGLQSYFIQRIEAFLNQNGRQIIGWDEILEGGLAPNATVMSWRGEEGGIQAAREGHDVIMSPTSHCYLDYYQSQHPDEPLAIGGFLPLEKVYQYHPVPEALTEEEAKFILGVQGNLWTEYITTPEKAEYMAFPRALALAEVAWTQQDNKDQNGFIQRLEEHLKWMKAAGINAANPLYHLKTSLSQEANGDWELSFTNLAEAGQIYYTTDGSAPTTAALAYQGPILLKDSGIYTGQAFSEGQAIGRSASINFQKHLATDAQLELKNEPSPVYNAGGNSAIINGIIGSNEKYGDKEWLGFAGDDFEGSIELKTPGTLENIQFRFFNAPGQWIYPPKSVEVMLKNSAGETMATYTAPVPQTDQKVVSVDLNLENTAAQYLEIKVPNFGIIPDGRQGAGNPAWLFIDEIILN